MLDDFTPILHRLPGRDTRIYAVGDVHIGAKEADVDGFSKFIEKVSREDGSYIVIVGDVLDFGTKSSMTNVYEQTMPPHLQIDKAVELLRPVADKILGCVGGNHERRGVRETDQDPLYAVCSMLRRDGGKGTTLQDIYRPNMAFLRIKLKNDESASKEAYSLLLVHGKTENKKRHFANAIEGVDAIVSGHTHNGLVEKPARLVFTHNNNVIVRPLVSLTATSWLGYSAYAAQGLYLPKATSDPQCLILEFKNSNNVRGNIRVSW